MDFTHATVRDLGEYAVGFGLLALLLLPPGFVLGWLTDVLAFRKRPFAGQLCLALLLSLAVCPVLTHLVGTFAGFGLVWVGYATVLLALPLVLWRRSSTEAVSDDGGAIPLLIAAVVWVALTGYALVDVEVDGGLGRCVSHYDHAKHTAVIDAVVRTGLPPENPSFHPGEARPLYYYYFWHAVVGVAGRLGGDLVTPRTLSIAGVAWAGLALLAAVQVVLAACRPGPNGRPYGLAFALLLVTGLDIVPVAFAREVVPHVEWWNGGSVAAWVVTGLWVPHHLVALTVVVLAGLLLRDAATQTEPRRQALDVILAGLAFASAFGLSIWVTLTAVAVLGVWWLVALATSRWREVLVVPAVGAVALAAVLPFVLELKQAQPEARFPLALEVRPFGPLMPHQAALSAVHPALVPLAYLAALPLNYALELGVFLAAGVLYWQRRRSAGGPWSRDELFLLVTVATSLALCAFVRSAVRHNDLGGRGVLLAQFVLLFALVPLLTGSLPPGRPTGGRDADRSFLVVLLVLGLLGTGYDLVVARQHAVGDVGPSALDLRRAYEWVRANTPRDAVLQQSWKAYRPPAGGGLSTAFEGEPEWFHLLYGHRQAAVSDAMHGTLFGVSPGQFVPPASEVAALFEAGTSPAEAVAICRRYGIGVVVVKAGDPAWNDPASWATNRTPDFANAHARVYLLDRPDRGGTHAARR